MSQKFKKKKNLPLKICLVGLFSLPIFISLNCQIKLDFSCNSEKLGMVFDNSKTS